MRKVLIATHGKAASGMKSTIQLFLKDQIIEYVDAYGINGNDLREIDKFISSVDEDAYIFTDIYGGSVNQYVISKIADNEKNIILITNCNIPLIIELLALEDMKTVDEINAIVASGRFNPLAINIKELLKQETRGLSNDDFFY